MKILLITGRLAAERVKKAGEKFGFSTLVAPISIASLLTPKAIAESINKNKLGNSFDMLIVPGLVRGDLKTIEKNTGIATFKGPKDVADLEFVLENVQKKKIKLSKTLPACELLEGKLRKKALSELKKIDSYEYLKKMFRKPGNILIGNLPVGKNFPVRVLAEIVNTEDLTEKEIKKKADYYIKSGADIIDLGFNEANPKKVRTAIKAVKRFNVPVSIDTMEEENIRCAIKCGIDMVLSLDCDLIKKFENVKIPSVVIPKRGEIPEEPEERIKILEENILLAKKLGFKNIVADLILQPANLGIVDSIVAYKKFSEKYDYPILMGAGNVTELLDADSIGVNALLCAIASECGASIVFTTEASDKTKGSVAELATAAKMMYLSKLRTSSPKDLGIDLLILKEKRLKRESPEVKVKTIKADVGASFTNDPKGYFKIFVDDKIKCVHFSKNKPRLCIEGNAKEISDTIISLGLVSSLPHALYLGRELEKAEFALRYGKSYLQG